MSAVPGALLSFRTRLRPPKDPRFDELVSSYRDANE